MERFESSLSIDTPENLPLEAELAGFGTRCIASLIDHLILTVLMFIIAVIYLRTLDEFSQAALFALIGILSLLTIVYHTAFEFVWNGQTPGKRAVGIRVVGANGLPMTTTGALLRNLLRLFDFFPGFYGLGLLMLFASKREQRLGDLAAGTVVIRDRGRIKLESVREDFTVYYYHINRLTPLPPYIRVDLLPAQERRTVVDYLQRRAKFSQRETLVAILATRIAQQMGVENEVVQRFESPYAAESFLEQVARGFEIHAQPDNAPLKP